MRYRRLTREEFEALEPEFVRYLASEGIPADEWAQRLASGEGVDAHLDGFSEMYFDRATAEIECLEFNSDKELWLFSFGERKAELVRLEALEDGKARLVGRGSKAYEPEARGREIFLLLEQGARPCSKERFEAVQTSNPR
jgi:hypothetical protein